MFAKNLKNCCISIMPLALLYGSIKQYNSLSICVYHAPNSAVVHLRAMVTTEH